MIAALILTHHSPELLARLVQRLEFYGAKCFIHVDSKVDILPFWQACSLLNPIFVEPRKKVFWGGFSIIEATLSLVNAALMDESITHFALMSGDSYPVKPREQFRHLMMRPFEQIESWPVPPEHPIFGRIAKTYFPDNLAVLEEEGCHSLQFGQTGASSERLRRACDAFEMKKGGFPWRYV
jgi:hypothetical protein